MESPSLLEYRVVAHSTQPKLTQRERIIQYFESTDQATITEAAEALQMTQATASVLISRLVRSGHLAYLETTQKARTVIRV
ncbi:MAG: helix-turn-helix domain-containing protein [Fimbriimonas sp.]